MSAGMEAFYSLAYLPTHRGNWGRYERQLIRSIVSFRQWNAWMPVRLFAYGPPSADLLRAVGDHTIDLCQRDPWVCPGILSTIPTLHRLKSLTEMPRDTTSLFLDCDTYFFGDPATLFGDEADVCAREEVMSRTSHFGYNPNYIDEAAFDSLFVREGSKRIPTFNAGVVRFSPRLQALDYGYFLDVCHRLLDGSLPYPSSSKWIFDQLAAALTVGRIRDVEFRQFTRSEVSQGSECNALHFDGQAPTVAHYWTGCEEPFLSGPLFLSKSEVAA